MDQTKRSIDEIFFAALEVTTAEERSDFLNSACANDSELRQRIERLLSAQPKVTSFLESPAPGMTAGLNGTRSISEQPGEQIGPYKLLQQIGEGGFGVVFLAEQERPVRRRVALKVIKPGMDTREVIARFEAERQALALMDHPNIAKVFDTGTTDTGRPYFVMELVLGVPITDYCDQCNLTTKERLALFVTVCQAVQHAHQKGVIHRDIKPTNVLVAIQDGQPAPKIIDFGVAKAIDQQLTERTLMTAFAQMVGTPLYMSPEQAELSPLGVDTRSDVYSLGVLLYELLSGTTPFDKERLHAASYDELRRIIRDEEPPRPSARISTLAADLATTVAEHRRTDARRLGQQVRGELDWIVMKCLEKDRNRRYETPNSLARDIERYLQNEPVQACPPSTSYRLRKFALRNKSLLAAGGAIAAALVVGLALSTWMYLRASTESARAKAVSGLLQEMLGSADATRAKGTNYKVRELLDDFSAGLSSQLADQPEVEADVRAILGRTYRSLRLPDKAQPYFEKAIALRRMIDGQQSEKLGTILVDGAWNLQDQQRYGEAEVQVNEAIKIYRQRGVTGTSLFHALEILQHVLINAGRDDDAERVTNQALDIASHANQQFPEQANLLHRYAGLKIKQGQFVEAEKLARQSVDMHRRLQGDQNPETAWALKTLVYALVPQQKLADAEAAARECVAIFRRQFPDDHPNVRDAMNQLATVMRTRGDKSSLEELAKLQADMAGRPDSPDFQVRLVGLLLASPSPTDAQKEESHRLMARVIDAYKRVPIEDPSNFRSRMNAADGCAAAIKTCVGAPGFGKEVDEMSQLLKAELPQMLTVFRDSNQCQWEIAMCYLSLGRVLFGHSDYLPITEHALSESIEILANYSRTDPNRPYAWIWLAQSNVALSEVQRESNRLVEAKVALQRGMKIYGEHEAKIAADIIAQPFAGIESEIIAQQLGYAYELAANHREEESAEFVRKGARIAKRLTDPAELTNALYFLALMQLRLGDQPAYRATCQALVDVPVETADDIARSRATWTSCLAPNALEPDDVKSLTKRAEEFSAHNSLGQRHYGLFSLGAALYRSGQYEHAAQILEESIVAYPANPSRGFDTINTQRLFLAMTKWQLGQQDEARRRIAETLPAIDKELQSPSSAWNRRATLEILRAEAERLIGSKETHEAVEKNNRTEDEAAKERPTSVTSRNSQP